MCLRVGCAKTEPKRGFGGPCLITFLCANLLGQGRTVGTADVAELGRWGLVFFHWPCSEKYYVHLVSLLRFLHWRHRGGGGIPGSVPVPGEVQLGRRTQLSPDPACALCPSCAHSPQTSLVMAPASAAVQESMEGRGQAAPGSPCLAGKGNVGGSWGLSHKHRVQSEDEEPLGSVSMTAKCGEYECSPIFSAAPHWVPSHLSLCPHLAGARQGSAPRWGLQSVASSSEAV